MSQLPEYPVFKPMPGRRATLECGNPSRLSNRTSLCGCKEQIQTSTPIPQKLSGKALPHSRRAGLAALGRRPGATRSADTADKTNKLIDTLPGFEFFALQKIQNRTRRRHLAGRGGPGGEAHPAAGGSLPSEPEFGLDDAEFVVTVRRRNLNARLFRHRWRRRFVTRFARRLRIGGQHQRFIEIRRLFDAEVDRMNFGRRQFGMGFRLAGFLLRFCRFGSRHFFFHHDSGAVGGIPRRSILRHFRDFF